jgi:putative transposase
MDKSESLRHSKYAVLHVVWCIKGKSAIHLARVYGEHKRNFVGPSFWARRHFVSTVTCKKSEIGKYVGMYM